MLTNFNPMPSAVSPAILAALARPQPGSLVEFTSQLKPKITSVLFPDAIALELFSCGRAGLYELAISSFAQKEALFCINGPLSQQWYDLAKSFDIETDIIENSYGKVFTVSQLEKKLTEQRYDAVFLVEVDPFTGAYTDIAELAAYIRKTAPDMLIVTDCSASITNVRPLKVGTETDILLSASDISLGLPPGLGLVAAGEHGLLKTLAAPGKGWYFNFAKQHLSNADSVFEDVPYPLLYALDKKLDEIFLEGLDEKIARTNHLAQVFRTWTEEKDFSILTDKENQAPNFTILQCLPQFTPHDLTEFLKSYDITIGLCPGEMKETFFSIAHMNATTEKDISHFFYAFNQFLAYYDTRNQLAKASIFRSITKKEE